MMMASVRDSWRNPPLALQQVGEPQPGPGEVLVEVRASSVNRSELALLGSRDDGWHPRRHRAPPRSQARPPAYTK